MFNNSKLIHSLTITRRICTTSRSNFKFKLTDELVKDFDEKQKTKHKEISLNQAIHTREGSLIMGRVSSERYKKVIKVGVPKYRLNEFLLLYIKEYDNVRAYDENDDCKPGDWILMRRQKDPIDKDVAHTVERVVYTYGKYIDPITGRRALGLFYDDDMERLEKIKLDL